ncbi:hypothetical protein [Pollutibacter soli]|uniref:hypothetical protein n=1 Tax=Pollutibacter soli TaxID=3034157 RepID=UPI003013F249
MKNNHPIDAEIQQYALLRNECNAEIINHIDHCATCKLKVEQYQLLFSGIEALDAPQFDFDLTRAVMTQLPAPKSKHEQFIPVIIFLVIAAVGCPVFYVFGKTFLQILSNLKGILSGIIFLTAIVLFTFLYIDQVRSYKNRINKLNLN